MALHNTIHSGGRIQLAGTAMPIPKEQSVNTHDHFFSRLIRAFGSGTFKVIVNGKTHRASNKSAYKVIKATIDPDLAYKDFKNWDTSKKVADLQKVFKPLKEVPLLKKDPLSSTKEKQEKMPSENPAKSSTSNDSSSSSKHQPKQEEKQDSQSTVISLHANPDQDAKAGEPLGFYVKIKWFELQKEQIQAIDFADIDAEQFAQVLSIGKCGLSIHTIYILDQLSPGQLKQLYRHFQPAHWHHLDFSITNKRLFDQVFERNWDKSDLSDGAKKILKALCPEQLRVLYPHFEYCHWKELSLTEQIQKMDLYGMTKKQFGQMCKESSFEPFELFLTSKEILRSLLPNQLDVLYSYFEYCHWQELSLTEQIQKMDLSQMTKKQFGHMCLKDSYEHKIFPHAQAILKSLLPNQLNLLYPYFDHAHWKELSVTEQIQKMDLSLMTEEQFGHMCAEYSFDPFELFSKSKEILRSLLPNQLKVLYPYFKEKHWDSLSTDNKIQTMDLSWMTKEQFDRMCYTFRGMLSVRSKDILEVFLPNQLTDLYPYFENIHWIALSYGEQIKKIDFNDVTQEIFDRMFPQRGARLEGHRNHEKELFIKLDEKQKQILRDKGILTPQREKDLV